MFHNFRVPRPDPPHILDNSDSPIDTLSELDILSEPFGNDSDCPSSAFTTDQRSASAVEFQFYEGPNKPIFQQVQFITPSSRTLLLDSPDSVFSDGSWPVTPGSQTTASMSTGMFSQYQASAISGNSLLGSLSHSTRCQNGSV
ncbi:hypothetical protein NEOLEDRAFT_560374 [Neolentinus lepideus HHB14362 ss-1]|uniref:Uncharacterized protein n=1 Tax=Neolentinus lepideus HHB14362 ss-1 TaxID=1314782 RepID=A0A165R6M6_9AGAM|nr:hypothetical protein NEOLEDRAFT_560374 [Neolentinus lepideus HHB14362 ss-1]